MSALDDTGKLLGTVYLENIGVRSCQNGGDTGVKLSVDSTDIDKVHFQSGKTLASPY